MPRIPTFESTIAPTAEVGAVKSNIQVSPKDSLAGALVPAANAVTQFYVKEKEISNKVEGGQLIADANQELLEIKEKSKLKSTPEEGVNFFNAGYKQVVDKYKSKANNNYIQKYFELNISSNKPAYVNNILKQTRANMVKTRVDQVTNKVQNKILSAVENENTFDFSTLSESILSDYQSLVEDGLISENDLQIYRTQLPSLVETEMVRKIATNNAFAALSLLDDNKNYKNIQGDARRDLKKELREMSVFQNKAVEFQVNSGLLESKKKVVAALKGSEADKVFGIDPKEIGMTYTTGNEEYDNQLKNLNNKAINNEISLDNNYLINDKIINKILNNEIKNSFEKFTLAGETEAKSITERIGNGSINLDDDNFFNNIFESQQNPELNKTNKKFFNFIDKVVPLIEGSTSSKYFDDNYNNRLSSFRQDMYSRFVEGLNQNIPVEKLLDSLSDNYIAKDILDYAPTKSQVRDALLISAKKEQPELVNTYFKRNENETPNEYITRTTEFYTKEDGTIGQRTKKKIKPEDVMKGSVLNQETNEETDNEFSFFSQAAAAGISPSINESFENYIKNVENAPLLKGKFKDFRHKSKEGGLDTIGFGHKLTEEENKNNKVYQYDLSEITKNNFLEISNDILRQDLEKTEKILIEIHGDKFINLDTRRKQMLIDMQFNIRNFEKPEVYKKFKKALFDGDEEGMNKEYKRGFYPSKKDRENKTNYQTLGRNKDFKEYFLDN